MGISAFGDLQKGPAIILPPVPERPTGSLRIPGHGSHQNAELVDVHSTDGRSVWSAFLAGEHPAETAETTPQIKSAFFRGDT